MHRIDGDGNVSGEFTQTPTPGNNATQVTADWLNAVQNEIVNFLETNGVTLDKADNTQFSALMVTLFTATKKVAGDYEIETVLIPDTTDKKLKITNKQTGKYFTITETRSPDGTTVEATHALGAVADGIDWIFDFSMHNYDSGIMKGVHVLQCFNADTKGAMYWVIRHRPTGETGYGTMEDYYMMKLDETNGLQVNAAASEGVAPTWVKVLTEANRNDFINVASLGDGWGAALVASAMSGAENGIDSNTIRGLDLAAGAAGTYGSQAIASAGNWVPPAGLYMISSSIYTSTDQVPVQLQIYTGSSWVGMIAPAGLILVDGTNYRIFNNEPGAITIYYRKIL